MIIASIDPGIKNLGICVADVSGNKLQEVLLWENYNLVSETSAQKATRCACGGPVSFSAPVAAEEQPAYCCKRCAKKGVKGLYPIDAAVIKSVISLREFGTTQGWTDVKKMTKVALLQRVQQKYLLPFKPVKAKTVTPQLLYEKLRDFVLARASILKKTQIIRIENQKAVAPFMREIQMMLFSMMQYVLSKEHGWIGTFEFVHPGAKNKKDNIAAGHKHYTNRKEATLKNIEKVLSEWSAADPTRSAETMTMWSSLHKKYDLADTLMMVLG